MHTAFTSYGQMFVSLYDEPFLSYGQYEESALNDPQMKLTCSRRRHTNMHTIYTRNPNFRQFYCTISRFRASFGKTQNQITPKLSWRVLRSKVTICILHSPRGPNFHPFLSANSNFRGNRVIFEFLIENNVNEIMLNNFSSVKFKIPKRAPPSRVSKKLAAKPNCRILTFYSHRVQLGKLTR